MSRAKDIAKDRWNFQIPALLTLVALIIRLWGIKGGLPFPGNIDEVNNYVQPAARIPEVGFAPFAMYNPVGYTYACWLVFGLLHGFGSGITKTFSGDPGALILDARLISAVSGALVIPVLYAAARIAFNRTTALFTGLIAAFAFLPVFYAHISVNDGPALLPIAFALLGAVGILCLGGERWYLVAGISSGLAAGTKYTGILALMPALAAAVLRIRTDGWRKTLAGCGALVITTLGAFVATNPYSLIDFHRFRNDLSTLDGLQSTRYPGEPQHNAAAYYAWTLTWGFGWVPLLAAFAGTLILAIRRRGVALTLAIGPAVLVIFLISKPLFFARYLLPAYPALILLCAFALAALLHATTRSSSRRVRNVVGGAVLMIACFQPFIHSVHFDRAWSRPGTASIAGAWAKANIPQASNVIVDQYMAPWWPDGYMPPRFTVRPDPFLFFDRGLWATRAAPSLLDKARERGWCWIVSSSYQAGRVRNEPREFLAGAFYYGALHRWAKLAFRTDPFTKDLKAMSDSGSLKFNYDWSYDNYPRDYERPGPVLSVYRLEGCTPTR